MIKSTQWSLDIQLSRGDFQLLLSLKGDTEPCLLIGPNGCGKSTILRSIAGAFKEIKGTIQVGDACYQDSLRNVYFPPEKRTLGFLPQEGTLFNHLSVLDNIIFALKGNSNKKESPKDLEARGYEILKQFGCSKLSRRRIHELSWGQKGRVALARTCGLNPRMLLLDEPFSSIDVTAQKELRRTLLSQIEMCPVPMILATHDVRDVLSFDGVVVAIENGRVVQKGPRDVLIENPQTPFIAAFFDGI
jgi:iron(III) transport system ATP-binding protein